jgi:glycosyltransferase involved in cell wall biosynthesis
MLMAFGSRDDSFEVGRFSAVNNSKYESIFLALMNPKLKIGILGSRGIPNAYGGFEQFAEYLSFGLVEKGHEIWVYNSDLHPYKDSEWRGVHIIHCKDLEHRLGTIGQFLYDFNCLADARNRNFDILLQLGYTSNSVWHRLWPKESINLVNMDGLEWKRTKYNKATRRFLKFAEGLAARHADYLIADSIGIQDYLRSEYGKASTYIPYGAPVFEANNSAVIQRFNLKPFGYYLLIARMEPENNIEMIIEGYMKSSEKNPLVIVSNTGNSYGKRLRKEYSAESIMYTGAIFDRSTIDNLRFYSSAYFHGHSVGGTNPSLLEAMGCQCNIAAHDNIFNRSVLTSDGDYFSNASEVAGIIDQISNPVILAQRKLNNLEKIKTVYNWNQVINRYEKLFLETMGKKFTHD